VKRVTAEPHVGSAALHNVTLPHGIEVGAATVSRPADIGVAFKNADPAGVGFGGVRFEETARGCEREQAEESKEESHAGE
jgi:hypothetical protein